MLEVELVAYETADFGVTAVIPGFGFLPDIFPDPYLVKWEIAGGLARSEELPGVAVPEAAFAGVIGVAPSHERLEASGGASRRSPTRGGPVADSMPERAFPPEAAEGLRTIPPRETGRQPGHPPPRLPAAACGCRCDVPGALFSIGDLHFAQGDGEVCGTAIEVAGAVHRPLRACIQDRRWRPRYPRVRDAGPAGPRSFATTGIPVGTGWT